MSYIIISRDENYPSRTSELAGAELYVARYSLKVPSRIDKPMLLRRLIRGRVDRAFFDQFGLEQKVEFSNRIEEAKRFEVEHTAQLVQKIMAGLIRPVPCNLIIQEDLI